MIWHFFEVWVLMLAAFAVGCPVGAAAYKLLARSPLAALQGDFADVVGDFVDGIKSRLGIGPVWRPEYRRIVERSAHDEEDAGESGRFPRLAARGPERLSNDAERLMIADQSDRPHEQEVGADGVMDDAAELVPLGEAGERSDDADTTVARPAALSAPRNSVPDDLQRIRGVGRRIEQRLNALGIFHFGQIAAWTPAEMRWVAQQLAFPDRIERDDWIGQAIVLAAGGRTDFVKSADRRRRRRQQALVDAVERANDEDDADEIAEFDVGDALADEDAEADGDDAAGEDAGEADHDDAVALESGDAPAAAEDDVAAHEAATEPEEEAPVVDDNHAVVPEAGHAPAEEAHETGEATGKDAPKDSDTADLEDKNR